MSTNKSQNLGLHLWVPSDNVSRAEFNENFETLDQAVHTLDESLNTLDGTVTTLGGTMRTLEGTVTSLGGTVNSLKGTTNTLSALNPVGRTEYDAYKTQAAKELSQEVSTLNATINQKVQSLNSSISDASSANRLVFLTSGSTSVTLPSLAPYRLLIVFCIGAATLYFNGDMNPSNYVAYNGVSSAGLICSGSGGAAVIFPDGSNKVSGYALQMSGGMYARCATCTSCNWNTLRTFQNEFTGNVYIYGLI